MNHYQRECNAAYPFSEMTLICTSWLSIQPQKQKKNLFFYPPHSSGLEDAIKQTKKYQWETNTAAVLWVYF